MPDEKQPDLKASLSDAWEAILVLEEEVNGLVLRQTAILEALALTLPGFAPEFDRIYAGAVAEQEKSDNASPQPVRKAMKNRKKN